MDISPADIERFWSRVDKSGDCWLWTRKVNRDGYGRFGGRGQNMFAHRFVWTITYGDIPKGLYICHACDNPRCVNPGHLFIGTLADNNEDMTIKGRRSKHLPPNGQKFTKGGQTAGTKNYNAKLTEDDVREIRRLRECGQKVSELSARYGVGQWEIYMIVQRKKWQHVN